MSTESKFKRYFIMKERVRFISGIMASLNNYFLEKNEFKINKSDLFKRLYYREDPTSLNVSLHYKTASS